MSHKQAKAGGAFINTVPENPKGQPTQKKKPTGKQEIEPYKWEIAPEEGLRSLFRLLAGIEIFDRINLQFSFNSDLRLQYALPEVVEMRKKHIEMFNRGERWVRIN